MWLSLLQLSLWSTSSASTVLSCCRLEPEAVRSFLDALLHPRYLSRRSALASCLHSYRRPEPSNGLPAVSTTIRSTLRCTQAFKHNYPKLMLKCHSTRSSNRNSLSNVVKPGFPTASSLTCLKYGYCSLGSIGAGKAPGHTSCQHVPMDTRGDE